MIRLKIRDSYFKIIDGYQVNESSREVTFSSLTVDFTNKTIADLPLKYQEVQLLELDDNYNITKVIYTGYVNNFVLPKMKNRNEYRELEIDLLSPLAMATVRTVDAIGTYELQSLVRELIQPLIDDGFVLREMNLGNNQITVNYLNETVESSLNKLSNKFNFWWYIDVNKNIYINSITYLMSLKPKLTYDDKLDGLIDIIPSIDATDYCNVVDFTNVRMYTDSIYYRTIINNEVDYEYYNPIVKRDNLPVGEQFEFDIPVVLNSKKTLENKNIGLLIFQATNEGGLSRKLSILYDDNGDLVLPSNVVIKDSYSNDAEWVLVKDAFFENLIVGLQYNGTAFNFGGMASDFGLMWTKIKVADEIEINKNKGNISQSGIVEKQIDMNEQWKTYEELTDIANSYIKINTSRADTVKLNIDENTELNVGDTVKIDKDAFLVSDTYIITDKSTMFNNGVHKWSYTLKNTNILENYVDLFRATEEEQIDKEYTLMMSNLIEEGIKESCEVVVNES